MANKPRKTRWAEGREVAEACPRGRHRLKRQLLPGLLTYLLMVGARYRRMSDAMKSDARGRTVPGAEEAIRHLDWSWRLIEELANRLSETFPSREWHATNEVVRHALGINGDGDVVDEVAFKKFLSE